jgi:glutamine synthetase
VPNSYKRLAVEEFAYGWSARKHRSLVFVPSAKKNVKEAKRIVFKACDPAANPYLAYSLIVAAGLDGIKNKSEPGDAVEVEGRKTRTHQALPSSLNEALSALGSDSKFAKSIVPNELLEEYMALKAKQYKDSLKGVSALELQEYYSV